MSTVTPYTLRRVEPADKPEVTRLLEREWGAAELLKGLVDDLRGTGVTRLRVTTTNDNTRALRFYQRAGFRLTALRMDAVTESRRIKPRIPEVGFDGIPIRDELELVMEISA